LSIDPLSCSKKFSSPSWSDQINKLIQSSCESPTMIQSSTYARTMQLWLKKTQGSILFCTKPRSWSPLLSFANQLYPACFNP
jgi:predicted nucleic acid-binding Zn ribbon protein